VLVATGQHRVSLEGIASVGLIIVLALPLLAGTPVPITCAPADALTHVPHTFVSASLPPTHVVKQRFN
jgi:hypothetical protein